MYVLQAIGEIAVPAAVDAGPVGDDAQIDIAALGPLALVEAPAPEPFVRRGHRLAEHMRDVKARKRALQQLAEKDEGGRAARRGAANDHEGSPIGCADAWNSALLGRRAIEADGALPLHYSGACDASPSSSQDEGRNRCEEADLLRCQDHFQEAEGWHGEVFGERQEDTRS